MPFRRASWGDILFIILYNSKGFSRFFTNLTENGKIYESVGVTLYMQRMYAWSMTMALWAAAMLPAAASLSIGTSGDEVTALQNSLVAAGYLARTVDGEYGSTTKAAVYLFQKDKGLEATGVADDATRDAIRAAEGETWRNGGGVVYAEGNRGDEIVEMQQRLKKAGFLKGDVDGVYGGDTVKAVKALQKAYDFPESGAIDEVTYEALRDVSMEAAAVEEVKEEPKVETRQKHRGKYDVGDRGDEVKSLQRKLKRLGYLDGDADGIYGQQTASAVKTFQKEEKISITGAADEKTLSRVNSVYADETGELSLGSKGRKVIRLQNQLLLHGYDPGLVDGVYGDSTRRAVAELQDEEEMPVTGAADETVWDALDSAPRFLGKYKKLYHMRTTAYTPNDGGGDGHTALGGFAGKGHAAVDPNVIPLGSTVFIEGYGYAICDDIGGAIQGMIIDVGVDTLEQAYEWGTRSNVVVYLVR